MKKSYDQRISVISTDRHNIPGYFIKSVFILLVVFAFARRNGYAQAQFTDIKAGLKAAQYGSAEWVDYDGDGDLDIMTNGQTANTSVETTIYNNDGNGHFTAVNVGIANFRVGAYDWGDYDGDGDLDLVFFGSDSNGNNISALFPNDNSNGFGYMPLNLGIIFNSKYAVDGGDFDGDGDLDLVVTGQDTANGITATRIYRNDGAGDFVNINAGLTGLYTGGVEWGDYDGDGDLDLVITGQDDKHTAQTIIYRNDGLGKFIDVKAGIAGVTNYDHCLKWGDYDQDGDLDLAITGWNNNIGYTTQIYRNDGSDTFTLLNAGLVGAQSSSVDWGDYDGDGDLDLVETGEAYINNTSTFATILYRNDGSGVFTDANANLPAVGYGTAIWGDYDRDGDPDLLVTGAGADSTMIYRNDTYAGAYQVQVQSVQALAGDTAVVPVNIHLNNKGKTVLSNELKLENYSSGLTFIDTDTTGTLAGKYSWSLVSNEVNSQLLIWGAGADPISADGTLYKLRFKVNATSGKIPIDIATATVDTNSSTSLIGGNVQVVQKGDVDFNNAIQAYDASLILRDLVGLETLSSNAQLAGDVDNSGSLTSQDATYILQYGVGLVGSLPTGTNTTGGADLLVSNTSVQPGETLTVPIQWTGGKELLSWQGKIDYNNSDISVESLNWVDGPANSLKKINANADAGSIQVAGAGVEAASTEGTLAQLSIHVNSTFSADSTVIYLHNWAWNGGKDSTGQIVLYNNKTTAIQKSDNLPTKFALNQNYPNPFNPSTNIKYELPEASDVRLDIFNSLGQRVETLVDKQQTAGSYHATFKAEHLPSGVYIYRLRAGNFTQTKKLLLIK